MIPGKKLIPLGQFIVERQKEAPYESGELSKLLHDLSIAAKRVNHEIRTAGLSDLFRMSGKTNVHGEEVQYLDQFANEEFISAIRRSGECCVIASEENEEIIPIEHTSRKEAARYVVYMDPIDGSSNSEVCVSVGTIFSIYERISPAQGSGLLEDCLQKGLRQVAAGYIIYGSATMLVYTTGNGVNAFTLEPSIGEFCLSHPDMKIPEGKFYSINEGNYQKFEKGIQEFIKFCQGEKSITDTPYASRHIGSFVADFHRNLIKGGIFIYPSSAQYPHGKLRLMYEANPMAFLIEQAGGKASNGLNRILEITPEDIHQRVPLIIGSSEMVELVEKFLRQHHSAATLEYFQKIIVNG